MKNIKGVGICGGSVSGRVSYDKPGEIYVQTRRTVYDVPAVFNSKGYVCLVPKSPSAHSILMAAMKEVPTVIGVDRDEFRKEFEDGDVITIDARSGNVSEGRIELKEESAAGFNDDRHRMAVRHLMIDPNEKKHEVEGIGPFATEYMFYTDMSRLIDFQRMLLGDYLIRIENLYRYQLEDFMKLFKIAGEAPVAIRFFDPPLHEFLPQTDSDVSFLSEETGIKKEDIERKSEEMREVNPMSGYRGCRIGVVESEIYSMQAMAIFDAAKNVVASGGPKPNIELIIPIVSVAEELDYLERNIISPQSDRAGYRNAYRTGIMVELPSICMLGKEVGPKVETCSFGTNDLTQMALGLSRDDSGKFLDEYRAKRIFSGNPFLTVQEPVKRLIKRFVDDAVRSNPNLKLGVCGAHARDPSSISFFEGLGFEYLSVMPSHINQTKAAAYAARSKINSMGDEK